MAITRRRAELDVEKEFEDDFASSAEGCINIHHVLTQSGLSRFSTGSDPEAPATGSSQGTDFVDLKLAIDECT